MRARERFRAGLAVRLWIEVPLPKAESLGHAEAIAGCISPEQAMRMYKNRDCSILDGHVEVVQVTDMAALDKVSA